MLIECGKYHEAIPELYKALELVPKGDSKKADTHVNLAIALRQVGNITGSAYHWKQVGSLSLI